MEEIKKKILVKKVKVVDPVTEDTTIENEEVDRYITINLTQKNNQIGKMKNKNLNE